MQKKDENPDEKLINLLEKQKRELVIRTLQKHEEIKNERAFSDKIIASLSDILIILNDRMEITKANREFVQSLGYDIEQSRILLQQILSPDDFPKLHRVVAWTGQALATKSRC